MPSSKKALTCKEIIEQILKGGVFRERVIRKVFKQFEGYRFKLALELKIPHEIALDAYIDSVAELEYKISTGKFENKNAKSCSTFIYTVCYYRCVDYIRKQGRTINESELDPERDFPTEEHPTTFFENEEIAICWESLNDTCKKVLQLTREGYSAKEIAKKVGLKNANSVGATKKTCINKLKNCIERLKSEK